MTVPIRYLSVNGAVEAKKKAKNAVVRHKYGEYKNVLLSDVQLEKLKEKFPYDREKRIEAIDSWVQQKGKGYDDYYATICNWARRDKEKTEKTAKEKHGINNYTDTGKPDYSNFSEQILKYMLLSSEWSAPPQVDVPEETEKKVKQWWDIPERGGKAA